MDYTQMQKAHKLRWRLNDLILELGMDPKDKDTNWITMSTKYHEIQTEAEESYKKTLDTVNEKNGHTEGRKPPKEPKKAPKPRKETAKAGSSKP